MTREGARERKGAAEGERSRGPDGQGSDKRTGSNKSLEEIMSLALFRAPFTRLIGDRPLIPVRLPSSRAQQWPWRFALICSCSTRRAPTPVHFLVLRFVRRLPSFVRPTICMLGALVANQVNGSQGRRGGEGRRRPHCNLVFPH